MHAPMKALGPCRNVQFLDRMQQLCTHTNSFWHMKKNQHNNQISDEALGTNSRLQDDRRKRSQGRAYALFHSRIFIINQFACRRCVVEFEAARVSWAFPRIEDSLVFLRKRHAHLFLPVAKQPGVLDRARALWWQVVMAWAHGSGHARALLVVFCFRIQVLPSHREWHWHDRHPDDPDALSSQSLELSKVSWTPTNGRRCHAASQCASNPHARFKGFVGNSLRPSHGPARFVAGEHASCNPGNPGSSKRPRDW